MEEEREGRGRTYVLNLGAHTMAMASSSMI